nr:hypothetical protein [Candidatus Sigynarchaeum springense]
MVSFVRSDVNVRYLRSLSWYKDSLVDLLGGGTRYSIDGTTEEPRIARVFAFPFDSIASNGEYAVLHEKYGTKGLLIRVDGIEQIREIDRSYYYARDYAFPIVVFNLPDGRDAIAHCPGDYCSLDIDLVDGGDRLTKRGYRSSDIFHSRLLASEDGRFLVENAWVWQPWNIVQAYDVKTALEEPDHLDGTGIRIPQGGSLGWEPESVAICGHSVVTASILEVAVDPLGDEEFEIQPAEEGVQESPGAADPRKIRRVEGSELSITDHAGNPVDLGVTAKRPAGRHYLLQAYDLDTGHITSSRLMPELVGRMMPAGPRHVVSFYDHPKLVEVATGKVIARWEDLYAGPEQAQPSAMMKPPGLPALACDPAHRRFAIGSKDRVSVIQIAGLVE